MAVGIIAECSLTHSGMVEMSDVVGEIPVCDGAVTVNDVVSVLSVR